MLPEVIKYNQKAWPNTRLSWLKRQHNHGTAYTSNLRQDALMQEIMKTWSHSPYPPELAPSDSPLPPFLIELNSSMVAIFTPGLPSDQQFSSVRPTTRQTWKRHFHSECSHFESMLLEKRNTLRRWSKKELLKLRICFGIHPVSLLVDVLRSILAFWVIYNWSNAFLHRPSRSIHEHFRYQITIVWFTVMIHVTLSLNRIWRKKKRKKEEVEWNKIEKRVIHDNAKFMTAERACKAIFRPTQSLRKGTFDSSRLSAEGRLFGVSAVPYCGERPQRTKNESGTHWHHKAGLK